MKRWSLFNRAVDCDCQYRNKECFVCIRFFVHWTYNCWITLPINWRYEKQQRFVMLTTMRTMDDQLTFFFEKAKKRLTKKKGKTFGRLDFGFLPEIFKGELLSSPLPKKIQHNDIAHAKLTFFFWQVTSPKYVWVFRRFGQFPDTLWYGGNHGSHQPWLVWSWR